MTYAEFLAFTEDKEERYEFVNGQPIAQAFPTKAHNRVLQALGEVVGPHVRKSLCDLLPGNALKVRD